MRWRKTIRVGRAASRALVPVDVARCNVICILESQHASAGVHGLTKAVPRLRIHPVQVNERTLAWTLSVDQGVQVDG